MAAALEEKVRSLETSGLKDRHPELWLELQNEIESVNASVEWTRSMVSQTAILREKNEKALEVATRFIATPPRAGDDREWLHRALNGLD